MPRYRVSLAALAVLPLAGTMTRAQATPPELRAVRELRIDAEASDLAVVNWMLIARDGTIAVAQSQDHRIRFFSVRGESLGTFGREGAGPGEFRAMTLHGWLGDTLWVGDFNTRRTTLISPARELVRIVPWPPTLSIPSPNGGPSGRLLAMPLWAIYADGSSLHFGLIAEPVPEGMPGIAPMLRVKADSTLERIVGWRPAGPDCSVAVEIPRGSAVASIPYCDEPRFAVAPDGSRIAFAIVERTGARTEHFRVVVLGSRGDTLLNRRYPFEPVAISKRVADSVRASRAAAASGPFADAYRKAYQSLPVPESYTPFERVLVGVDGTVWIERMPNAPQRLWLVLDARGNPLGTVRVPRNVVLRAVARDRFWATERDDNDLESIVRYRFEVADRAGDAPDAVPGLKSLH